MCAHAGDVIHPVLRLVKGPGNETRLLLLAVSCNLIVEEAELVELTFELDR